MTGDPLFDRLNDHAEQAWQWLADHTADQVWPTPIGDLLVAAHHKAQAQPSAVPGSDPHTRLWRNLHRQRSLGWTDDDLAAVFAHTSDGTHTATDPLTLAERVCASLRQAPRTPAGESLAWLRGPLRGSLAAFHDNQKHIIAWWQATCPPGQAAATAAEALGIIEPATEFGNRPLSRRDRGILSQREQHWRRWRTRRQFTRHPFKALLDAQNYTSTGRGDQFAYLARLLAAGWTLDTIHEQVSDDIPPMLGSATTLLGPLANADGLSPAEFAAWRTAADPGRVIPLDRFAQSSAKMADISAVGRLAGMPVDLMALTVMAGLGIAEAITLHQTGTLDHHALRTLAALTGR